MIINQKVKSLTKDDIINSLENEVSKIKTGDSYDLLSKAMHVEGEMQRLYPSFIETGLNELHNQLENIDKLNHAGKIHDVVDVVKQAMEQANADGALIAHTGTTEKCIYANASLQEIMDATLENDSITSPEAMHIHFVSQELADRLEYKVLQLEDNSKFKALDEGEKATIGAYSLLKDFGYELTKEQSQKLDNVEINDKDKQKIIEGLKSKELDLENLDKNLQADKDIVLAATKNNGLSLEYASSELKADKEIVLAAVANRGSSLEYASPELKADREIVLAAVKDTGFSLQYASLKLRADKEIVLAAVQQNGMALEDASSKLRADKDVVLAAVTNNCKALMFADDKLKDDRDVVKQAYYDVCVYHVQLDSHNDYLSDAEIEKEVQRYADEVLQYASPRLQKEFGMSKEKQQELQQEQTKGWGARTGNSKSHGIAD